MGLIRRLRVKKKSKMKESSSKLSVGLIGVIKLMEEVEWM